MKKPTSCAAPGALVFMLLRSTGVFATRVERLTEGWTEVVPGTSAKSVKGIELGMKNK
jgi:hypothetical protein